MTEGEPPADDEGDDEEPSSPGDLADSSEADSRTVDSLESDADDTTPAETGSQSDTDPRADADAQADTNAEADTDSGRDDDQPDFVESTDVDGRDETPGEPGADEAIGEADDSANDRAGADSPGSDGSDAVGIGGTNDDEADDAEADEAVDVEDDEIEDTGADDTAEEGDGADDVDRYDFDEAGDGDAEAFEADDTREADIGSRAGADEADADEFESAPATETAGTTSADASGAASSVGAATPAGAGGGGGGVGAGTGAPDDQEMPLTEHIEEMVKRLGIVIVVMAAVSAVTFPFADRLINFLWYSFLPGAPSECAAAAVEAFGSTDGAATASEAACPRLYHPLALLLARLKVASLTGFIIALPVFVYQTYLFMRPGLYPNERRYYLSSVPTSLILAGIGLAFAHFLVLPVIFSYFLGYSQPVAEIAFGLSDTFNLIVLMLGMFALIFQIPLFVMLAIMMGVTTRNWLEDRRLYFWAGFAGIAFLFSPDPTGMAPFIVAVTMIVLFEGTLLLLRWTGR